MLFGEANSNENLKLGIVINYTHTFIEGLRPYLLEFV